MDLSKVFSENHIATLHDWLIETGELYVHLDFPRSGGSGFSYFVRSLAELRALLSRQEWPEVQVFIYRRLQYPIRGRAEDTVLRSKLEAIPDGTVYSIVSLNDYYPSACTFLGCGESLSELRADLEKLRGHHVGIGTDPMDSELGELDWVRAHPEEVMYVAVSTNDYNRVRRAGPEKLRRAAELWEREA